MGWYYPQSAVLLRIMWEDFGDKENPNLKQVYDLSVQARRVEVEINDYTQADTFRLEIDYKQFPFDPRTIRSCGVTIHIEDMGGLVGADGKRIQIVPRQQNARFIGFADEESIKFNDSTRTVTLEGRDLTALLIDQPYLKGTYDLDRRVDVLVQRLLRELPATEKIEVDVRVEGQLPIVSSFTSKEDLDGKGNAARKQSYWDVIQGIVSRAGLIAYIELDKLVITTPRVLNSGQTVVKFIYGKNLKDLEFKRKLGRQKGFNVAVKSLDLKNKRVVTVRIPEDATAEWSKKTGTIAKRVTVPRIDKDGNPLPEEAAPFITYRVPNISNREHLIKIGQEVFEEYSRQQIEGSFETKDMLTSEAVESTGADPKLFDVLDIRNSTPVSIEIEQGDLKGISRLSTEAERIEYLINRGYAPKVAAVLGSQIGRLSTPMYTRAVKFTMDSDNGFTCKVDFVNFVETKNRGLGGR